MFTVTDPGTVSNHPTVGVLRWRFSLEQVLPSVGSRTLFLGNA